MNTNDTQKKFCVFFPQRVARATRKKMEDAPVSAEVEEDEEEVVDDREDDEDEDDEDEDDDDDNNEQGKKNKKIPSNNNKKKSDAIANTKITEEERNARIQKLKELLERQRSEFCRLYSTATGDVTTIKISKFIEYGISHTTKCGSCRRPVIGHCATAAYMINDHVLAPYFLADRCFTCHHRLSASAASCGTKDNMLWDRPPPLDSETTTTPVRYCHLDRFMMPVCRFHVDTHALAVPSFDPIAQRVEMKEFYNRWGFVKARTTAPPELVSSFKEGLVDMLAIMNNRTPEEMRVKMASDHWETDCTWPGSESQEFGNVCDAPSAAYKSYSTLVQDRRAWQTRKLAWDALVPFFSDRDNVSASMAPFVVCPKTEVLTKSFLRSLLTNPRAQHEVMNGFYPYTETRHNTCGISIMVCPEAWGLKRTLPDGTEVTERHVFRSLWKGVVPISFPHGRYPEDFPFNNMIVPIETNVGEVVVFRGERPFRLRALTENLLGMFVGAANVAPKKATKEGRGNMILQQKVRIKLFNWPYYIYPHYETKRAILSMVVTGGSGTGDPAAPGAGQIEQRWGLRKMEDFVGYTQKMTIADFAEFAVQIFGTKHADQKCWPSIFKNVHGDRAPLGVKSDTIAEKYDSEAIVIENPSSSPLRNSDNKNSGQRKKRKKGAPPTLDNNNATTMNGTTSTNNQSKGVKPMQTSTTTTTKKAIVPSNKAPKKAGVDVQTLERSVTKQIQARVKPSSTSPSHVPAIDNDDDREVKKKNKVVVAAAAAAAPPDSDNEEEEEDVQPMQVSDDDNDEELMPAIPATLPSKKKKKTAIVPAAVTTTVIDEDGNDEGEGEAATTTNKKKRSRSSAGGTRAKTAGIPDNLLFDADEAAQCLETKDVPTHLRINPDFMGSQDGLFSVIKNHLFMAGPGVTVPEVDEEDQQNLVLEVNVEIPCVNEDGDDATEDRNIVSVFVPMDNEVHLQVFDLFAASGIPSSLESDLREYVIAEYCTQLEPKKVAGNTYPTNTATRLYGCNARIGGKVTPPEVMPDCISQMLTCINDTLMVKTMQKPAFNQVIAYTFQTLNAVGNAIKFDQCVPGSSVLVLPIGYSGRVMQLRSLKPGGDPAKTKAVPIMHNIMLVSGLAYCFDESIHENQELKCSLEIKHESKTPDQCSPLTVLFFMTVNELPPAKGKKKSAATTTTTTKTIAKSASQSSSSPPPPKGNKKQKLVEDDDEEVAPAVAKPSATVLKKKTPRVVKVQKPPQQQQQQKKPPGKAAAKGGVADDWDPEELKKQYNELYKNVGKAALESDNAFLKSKWGALRKAASSYMNFGAQTPVALPRFRALFNECYSLANPAEEEPEEEEEDVIPMDLGDDDNEEDPNLVVEGEFDDEAHVPPPSSSSKNKKQATITATMTMVPRKNNKKPAKDEEDDDDEHVVAAATLGRKVVLQGNKIVRQSTREKEKTVTKQQVAAVEALPELRRKYAVYTRKWTRKGLVPVSFNQWKYNLEHSKTADSRGLGGEDADEEDDDDEEEDEDFDSEHGYGALGAEDSDDDDDDDDDIVDDDDDDDDGVTPAEKLRLRFHDAASCTAVRLDQFKDATPQLLIGPNKKLVISELYDAAYNAISLATRKSTEENVHKMNKAMDRFEKSYKAYMSSDGNPKKAKILAQLFPANERKKKRPDEEQQQRAASPSERAELLDAVVAAGGEISVEGWNPRAPEDVSHQFVMALVDAVATLTKGNRLCTKVSVFLSKNIIGKSANDVTAELMRRFSDDIWPAAKSVMDQGTTRQNPLPVPPDNDEEVKVAEVLDLTTPEALPAPPLSNEKEKEEEEDEDEEEEEDSLLQRELELKRANDQAKAASLKTPTVTAADVPVAIPMEISDDEGENSSSSSTGGGEPGPDIALPVPPLPSSAATTTTANANTDNQPPRDEEEEYDEEDDEDAAQGSDAEAAKDGVVVALPVSPNTKNVQRNFPKQASLDVAMEPDATTTTTTSSGQGGGLPLIAYHNWKTGGDAAIFFVAKTKEQLKMALNKYGQKEEAFVQRTAPANWKERCIQAKLPPVEQSLKQFTVAQLFGETKI